MGVRRRTFLAAVVAASIILPIPVAAAAPSRPLAQNVILLIDDGAGYAHHEVGSLYATGLRAGEAFQAFPFQFAMSTYSRGDVVPPDECRDLVGYDPERAWGEWLYVTVDPTDSAASATAMATGVKTYDAAVGVDCDGKPVQNIVETAETLGKATGVVSSVPISHATPAAFVGHNGARTADTALAEEMIERSTTDVIMGGGHGWFDRQGKPTTRYGANFIPKATWDKVVAGIPMADADGDGTDDAWTLVETREAFQALTVGDAPERVLGVAQVRRTLQEDRVTYVKVPPGPVVPPDVVIPPFTAPFIPTTPTLAEMTAGALNVLDQDPEGFFLMVEGGAIDWAAHDGQTGFLIEEEMAFADAVDAVLAWVDQHSNWGETLVIVASDHETGYLTGPGSGDTTDGPVWTPVADNGIGAVPGVQYNTIYHANQLVPVYAKGDAGRLLRQMVDGIDPVRGAYIDNTDLHTLMLRAFGVP